jgi:hypothetical protein
MAIQEGLGGPGSWNLREDRFEPGKLFMLDLMRKIDFSLYK